jgi:hypothetical protein
LPAKHTLTALGSAHFVAHPPQFDGSFATSTSHPSAADALQSFQPVTQDTSWHPFEPQSVTAWGREQVHPHWFSTPPPPQDSGAVHEPQSSRSAQPSDI